VALEVTMNLKKLDPIESTAVLALIIKVGQFLGESLGYQQGFPEPFAFASFLSLFLFGVSIVLWLRSSREQLKKVDVVADRVEAIKKELDQLDYIARYGSAPVHLARLAWADEHTHGRAGGRTLYDVLLNIYAMAAKDLYDMTRGDRGTVEFAEYHLVDRFLRNFVQSLPPGAVWLGATRLQAQDAWTKGTGEPSYLQFQEEVEKRTQAKTLRFFRLWCFDNDSRVTEMQRVIASQAAAGLEIRTIVSDAVPDMSLVWRPKRPGSNNKLDVDSFLGHRAEQDYEPVCAIEFTARGGKELDAMRIHSPTAERFLELRSIYLKWWRLAKLAGAEAHPIPGGPAEHPMRMGNDPLPSVRPSAD
jgi:hypothetical protein